MGNCALFNGAERAVRREDAPRRRVLAARVRTLSQECLLSLITNSLLQVHY